MKILVTGGAGFIGSNIVDRYLELGHKVVIVDDLSSGFKKVNRKAKFYKVNIADMELLEEVFRKEQPDVVNHHAAMNSWDFYDVHKDTVLFQSDVVGTYNVIALCLKYRVKKLIHASSAAVYGDKPFSMLPLPENIPLNPLSLYGLSKLIAEQLITFYGTARNLHYTIFRYANVYGSRQKGGAISLFITNMLANKVTKIYGGGKKTRDYVYVGDVVEANVMALKKGKDSILNIGTGKETSDLGVYALLKKQLGDPYPVVNVEDRIADIKRNSLSAKKAKKEIGWSPRYHLEDGLKKTVEWYTQEHGKQ